MILTAFLFFSTVAMDGVDLKQALPTADDVVSKLIQRDDQRQSALEGYTAARRYVLENSGHHKRAEMLVRVRCLKDGSKEFETISSSGWGSARKHVFPRLLEGEAEASHPGVRDQSRILPKNYSFEMAGTESINGRPAYVIDITPKESRKYLVHGRIWVDVEDYAIVRMEGKPAKNPSFWIKSAHFVHNYEKHGTFWFPASDHSLTDARFFGATEVTIDYFDYEPHASGVSAARETGPGGLR
jgi:hypothetical protein